MIAHRLAAPLFGALALAATFASAPASAAPVSAPAATAAASAETGLVQKAWHRGRPHYGHRRYYGPPRYSRPRCFISERRVWNGYRWVFRPVRVCR